MMRTDAFSQPTAVQSSARSVAARQPAIALRRASPHGRREMTIPEDLNRPGHKCADEARATEAFGNRSNALRSALTRFFSSRGIVPTEIDDLVQDVFLRVVRRGSLSALDNVEAYVFTTAQSVLTDRGRRRATRLVDKHVSFHPDVHGGEDLGPDRIAAGRQQLSATTRALMELPERARQVFILRRLEGMAFGEIALRLGISLSSAEKDMQQAVRHVVARAGEAQ
ncbi:RNA polymerase sigma factor [Sphingomonas faeni]|uniref:RNA polymerase sigma factor n=1 Tax=Sphingomonas faeni TaxID=185950 RepID=UPI0033650499